MILIVCPFTREAQLDHVLGCWRRQTYQAALLLVGRERAAWADRAREAGAYVLVGHETIGSARSAGQDVARYLGAQWVVQWDDDNHYGPDYVRRIAAAAGPNVDVISYGLGFVRMGGELWWFPSGVPFFPGHSTAVRASVAPDFPPVSRGEDVAWSRAFAPPPERVRWLTPWGLVYNREGTGHAYDADDAEFLRTFQPGVRLGKEPDSFVDTPRELPSAPHVFATDDAVFASLERRLSP